MSNVVNAADNLTKEAQCIRGAVATEVQHQHPGQNVSLGQTVASGAQAEVQTFEGVVKQVYETPYQGQTTKNIPLGVVQIGGTTTIAGPPAGVQMESVQLGSQAAQAQTFISSQAQAQPQLSQGIDTRAKATLVTESQPLASQHAQAGQTFTTSSQQPLQSQQFGSQQAQQQFTTGTSMMHGAGHGQAMGAGTAGTEGTMPGMPLGSQGGAMMGGMGAGGAGHGAGTLSQQVQEGQTAPGAGAGTYETAGGAVENVAGTQGQV